ncbi:hypothetical protein EDB19DRAFT_1716631 [Suillus lakei]|nr:hypothetical protein EDB19DRAFT_1716631 [Suillus lakei]
MEEVFMKCGKAMAHLCSQSLEIRLGLRYKFIHIRDHWGGNSRFVRDAFMDGRIACNHLKNTQQEDAGPKYKAHARTAMRIMVVHGQHFQFSLPDDEDLIWDGDMRWRDSDGLMPSCEEFDWLIDYLTEEVDTAADDETVGDTLLALSAMHGLGSSVKRRSYITALIHCMGPTLPPRVRHAALRAVADAREELASITNKSMPRGVDAALLDEFSYAVLPAVRPNQDQALHDSGPDASFHGQRDCCYLRLVFALAMNDAWRERLTRDGHLERCISLAEDALERRSWVLGCYLAGIFACIDPSDQALPLSPAQERWRTFIREKWRDAHYYMWVGDYVKALPALVTGTRQDLPGWGNSVPNKELAELAKHVHDILESLQKEQAYHVNRGLDQAIFDAALSSVQGLYDDLSRMIDNPNTPQRDNMSLESRSRRSFVGI